MGRIATPHAFGSFLKKRTINHIYCDLYEDESYEKVTGLEGYNLTEKVCWKTLGGKEEKITGRIIGGCIDIITELSGTKYDGTKKFIEKYGVEL